MELLPDTLYRAVKIGQKLWNFAVATIVSCNNSSLQFADFDLVYINRGLFPIYGNIWKNTTCSKPPTSNIPSGNLT